MTQLSVNQYLAKVELALNEVKENFLANVAEDLVYGSDEFPVDTGAYAESMSVSATPNGGRSRTSKGRATKQDPAFYRAVALDNMFGDIQSLIDSPTLYFTNQSPHASMVEYGGATWLRDGYYVYTNTRARLPLLLEEAIQTTKAGMGG